MEAIGADRATFSSDRGMGRSMHEALARQLQHHFLESPDHMEHHQHGAQEFWIRRILNPWLSFRAASTWAVLFRSVVCGMGWILFSR